MTMRLAALAASTLFLAAPALAADEAATAASQGLTDISEIRVTAPSTRLPDFAPGVVNSAVISVAASAGHFSYFVQASVTGNVCTGSPGSGKADCDYWDAVPVRTDSGLSDIIASDNDDAVAFVHAMLDGKRQTLLLTARRAMAAGPPPPRLRDQPSPVTFTAYALHIDWGIDDESLSFQPIKSWMGTGSYCRMDAALEAIRGNSQADRC